MIFNNLDTANINIYPTGVFGVMFIIFFALVIIIGSQLTLQTGNFVIPVKIKKKEKKRAL